MTKYGIYTTLIATVLINTDLLVLDFGCTLNNYICRPLQIEGMKKKKKKGFLFHHLNKR